MLSVATSDNRYDVLVGLLPAEASERLTCDATSCVSERKYLHDLSFLDAWQKDPKAYEADNDEQV